MADLFVNSCHVLLSKDNKHGISRAKNGNHPESCMRGIDEKDELKQPEASFINPRGHA